ncbi:MAG: hypothetical protein FWG43_04780, partial [Clostridiales bacterium]|nr:hypothetical protein [Clostridiales bacterium]
TNTSHNYLVRIGMDNDWQAIAGGDRYTVALKIDGSLWAWGDCQLDDGTNTNYNSPVRIGTNTDWAAVAAGAYHTLALKTDGSLWAWGWNYLGQLGDGTNTDRNYLVRIGMDNDWQAMTGGDGHTIATKTDGSLWAWGWNDLYQLGDGTDTNRYAPIRVGANNDWAATEAGSAHTLTIKTDGSLWVWGNNFNGQLGIGTTPGSNTPVRIGTDNDWGGSRVYTKDFTITVIEDDSYNYTAYMIPHETTLNFGDTLLVDVMLKGNINYTQITADIAFDEDLLEFDGYTYLNGWVANVSTLDSGNISVRSMPSSNMVLGVSCVDEVKIATLKFKDKGDHEGEIIETTLDFDSVFVAPAGAVREFSVAPSKPVTVSITHGGKNQDQDPYGIEAGDPIFAARLERREMNRPPNGTAVQNFPRVIIPGVDTAINLSEPSGFTSMLATGEPAAYIEHEATGETDIQFSELAISQASGIAGEKCSPNEGIIAKSAITNDTGFPMKLSSIYVMRSFYQTSFFLGPAAIPTYNVDPANGYSYWDQKYYHYLLWEKPVKLSVLIPDPTGTETEGGVTYREIKFTNVAGNEWLFLPEFDNYHEAWYGLDSKAAYDATTVADALNNHSIGSFVPASPIIIEPGDKAIIRWGWYYGYTDLTIALNDNPSPTNSSHWTGINLQQHMGFTGVFGVKLTPWQ